jgi:hypothetical protein
MLFLFLLAEIVGAALLFWKDLSGCLTEAAMMNKMVEASNARFSGALMI